MTQQEKTFIAFMEGVCKKFNCVEAVAPLSEGFKAYCETAAMARAFGKATYGKNDKNPTVKAARDSYKKDLKNYCKDKDAKARAEAFHMGNEEQWLENRLKDSKKSCSGKTCTEASDAAYRPLRDGFKAYCESEAGSDGYHTEVTSAGKVEIDQGDFSTQYFVEVYSKDGWTDELAEDLAYHIQKKFAPGDAEVEYLSPMDNLNDDRGGATYQIAINLNVTATYDDVKNNVVAAIEPYSNVCSLDKC